jgi:type II secretory ATPase GspE/PulE/Tfp pilus assembly ATPase PilB-like protein
LREADGDRTSPNGRCQLSASAGFRAAPSRGDSRTLQTATAAAYLANAVQTRANILVAGGTSTGKTTLTNARLAVVADSNDRIILIEDTRELML